MAESRSGGASSRTTRAAIFSLLLGSLTGALASGADGAVLVAASVVFKAAGSAEQSTGFSRTINNQ